MAILIDFERLFRNAYFVLKQFVKIEWYDETWDLKVISISLSLILLPVGYGRLGSPGCQVVGAEIALVELIRCANLISSSDWTGLLLALAMDCNFCFAWKIAVA
jgi:hypothetical protein